MHKVVRIIAITVLVVGLILVRQFESDLFYDPLLEFFKIDHTTQALPEMEKGRLLLHLVFRFVLNTFLSLLILWFVFRDKSILKISSLLYAGLFVVLSITFIFLLNKSAEGDHMALFYVRRFLIQPLFLLLLLPAFYFHKRS
ncbi:exosortase F system-associated protein [Aureitalea sp. L0-47]|uniref:exosortase F system-associated membrane protein n=1 Tax=Aureitalea sp. L0-47 TaxID=2816962 RepID=UPI002237C9DA|nr:exosortase F system-associated protein [Aureitalea sp. L0-47]MCW5518719.1 exosortase F system-associated protein [Aureitalea sp. L0-47]